jgi:molybdopterin synthase sulfur carrier subunit
MADISVTLLWFAQMADQRGLSEETVTTETDTLSALFDQLAEKHNLSGNKEILRVAINDQYVDWHSPLNHNDTIVFIAPVAGG